MKKYFSKTAGFGSKKPEVAVSCFFPFLIMFFCTLIPRVGVTQQRFVKTYAPTNCQGVSSGNLLLLCITKSLKTTASTYYMAGIQDKNVYVAEVDAFGVVLQEKLVAVSSATYTLRSMTTDSSGNIVIVGTSTIANPYKSFLMKLSPALSLLLHHTYNNQSFTGQSQMVFCDVKDPGPSYSNYYISGGVRDFDNATASDVLLIAVDKNTGAIINRYQGDATKDEDIYDALVAGPNANGTTGLYATGRLSKASSISSGLITYRPWINRYTPTATSFAFSAGARYLDALFIPPQTPVKASLYSSSLITDNSFLLYAWTGDRTGIDYGLHSGLGKYNSGSLTPVWQKQYSFTPVPASAGATPHMLLNKIATDPNGYVAEGNWWSGGTSTALPAPAGSPILYGGKEGEMILLRTNKSGVPVWSKKINNVLVNSATHNAAFVIDGPSIFAVGYRRTGNFQGVLVKIPLLDGAMDTICARSQTTKVDSTFYSAYDSVYTRPINPADSNNSYAINCTTTQVEKFCDSCFNAGLQLNADFNLAGNLQAGNGYYTVTASGFATSPNSHWIVSETPVSGGADMTGTVFSSTPGFIWGTAPSPPGTGFNGYNGTSSSTEINNSNSLSFLVNHRYRFRHILFSTNNCDQKVSDTVTKAIMMCVNCRTAGGNGFIIETERASSNGNRSISSTTQISYTGGLKILPNPVQAGVITIEYPQANSGEVQISIADMQGKKMLEKDFVRNITNGRFTIDVSRLVNGTYTVTLLNNGASVTQKLVVAR